MPTTDLRSLIEKLDKGSVLYQECALILPELDDTATVDLQSTIGHIGADMASTYQFRFRRLTSKNIVNRSINLAADYFSKNVGKEMRFALVETASFKGYAFIDPELSFLLTFPYSAKSAGENPPIPGA